MTFRYGQMWCRPYDYEKISLVALKGMTTRQRRLMGDMGAGYSPTDYYKPQDQLEKILTGLDW
ncbi:MAG: hypothetical protein CMO31_08865 [Trueperaceae bacterium]|nr:hypothetical protein [Trueperaceae bacterium]